MDPLGLTQESKREKLENEEINEKKRVKENRKPATMEALNEYIIYIKSTAIKLKEDVVHRI